MQHIFQFSDETRRYETDGSFSSAEAEEALLHGTLFYKVDGSNGMIQVIHDDNGELILRIFQRLDTKGKEVDDKLKAQQNIGAADILPLPPGKNPSAYAGHSYVYSEITTEGIKGKKAINMKRAQQEVVEKHKDIIVAYGEEWISVEWVGEKFNKTPNVPHPVALAIHREQRVENELALERSYEGMRQYLVEDCVDQPVEGFVLEHGGVYWKVRADCFLLPKGEKGPFEANRDKTRPPVYLI